jgi:hypothetical protein
MNKELILVSPEIEKAMKIITSLKGDIDKLASNLSFIKIVDEGTLSIAQQNLSKATQMVNFIEEKRVLIKEKPLAECKWIDKTCKDLPENLVKAITGVKKQVLDWDNAKKEEAASKQAEIDRVAAEEKAKLQAEADRKQVIQDYLNNKAIPTLKSTYEACVDAAACDLKIAWIERGFKPREFFQEFADEAYKIKDNYIDLIKTKKEQYESANTLSDTEKEIAKQKEDIALQKAEMAQREANIKAAEEKIKLDNEQKQKDLEAEEVRKLTEAQSYLNKTKGIRYNWGFELNNIEEVPVEWLTLDETKVKEYIKENKDKLKEGLFNGVRFIKKASVTA